MITRLVGSKSNPRIDRTERRWSRFEDARARVVTPNCAGVHTVEVGATGDGGGNTPVFVLEDLEEKIHRWWLRRIPTSRLSAGPGH